MGEEYSPLALLCVYDRPTEFVQALLAKGADVNQRLGGYNNSIVDYCFSDCFDSDSEFLDHERSFNNTINTLELLVMSDAEITSDHLRGAIHWEAPSDVIQWLIREGGVKANEEYLYDFCCYQIPSVEDFNLFLATITMPVDFKVIIATLCQYASSNSIIKYILQLQKPRYRNTQCHSWIKCYDSYFDKTYKGTILHYACLNERNDLVEYFLNYQVDTNCVDSEGHTPYDIAIKK